MPTAIHTNKPTTKNERHGQPREYHQQRETTGSLKQGNLPQRTTEVSAQTGNKIQSQHLPQAQTPHINLQHLAQSTLRKLEEGSSDKK
jgi:hypothetical protein